MDNASFSYSYSAKNNSEIEAIRKKYLPKAENRFEQLKRLDREVQSSGTLSSLCLGIISALVFGIGICLCLGVLSGSLILGVLICISALPGIISAYPLYRKISTRKRQELIPIILELADKIDSEKSQINKT